MAASSMNPLTTLPPPCRNHPGRDSVVRCEGCSRTLCDECYRFRVDARPMCARCAYEHSTRATRRVSLAVSFLFIVGAAGLFTERRFGVWETYPVEVIFGVVTALGIAAAIALSGRSARVVVEPRDPDEPVTEPIPARAGSIYRASARQVLMAAAPRVSARATALVMLAAFAGSAVMVPASMRLPRWIETELVLSLWWVIVVAALTTLLYRGFRLRDDYVYFTPWNRPPAVKGDAPAPAKEGCSGWSDGLGGCATDGEGLLAMLALAIVLSLALGAAWVLVELALPLVFFLMYWLFMRAIGRVANDRHGCEGSLARSLGWGLGWATVYVAPIAVATWALHALHR